MALAAILLVLALLLFGLGAVVEGLFWLVAVGAIFLVAAIAAAVGMGRRIT